MNIERGLSDDRTRRTVNRFGKLAILGVTIAVHLVLIFTITIQTGERKEREDTTLFKMVDVREYVPPPPEPKQEEKPEEKKKPEEVVEVPQQEPIAEDIIEVEEEVEPVEPEAVPQEETASVPGPPSVPKPAPIEYLPQHKISVPPLMPVEEIRKRIVYPPLANRQRIEGVVFLELYIDKEGMIRKIVVLKDPGYGFAEAAIKALEGLRVEPAKANGVEVAVKFRYPIRFTIK
jgi:protein TonB